MDWTEIEVPCCCSDKSSLPMDQTTMKVSNPSFVPPSGYTVLPAFLNDVEAHALLSELDGAKWEREGFVQRKRVQRYDVNRLSPVLTETLDKFRRVTDHSWTPTTIVVEEYPFTTMNPSMTNMVTTTYESLERSDSDKDNDKDINDNDDDGGCFVASVSLLSTAWQHTNRPERRAADCWKLRGPDDWTDTPLEPGVLHVKSGEALWDWRYNVMRGGESDGTDDRVVVLKFCSLGATTADTAATPTSATDSTSTTANSNTTVVDNVNRQNKTPGNKEQENSGDVTCTVPAETNHDDDLVSNSADPQSPQQPTNDSSMMPPMQELLTIIVTTSPIQSHPSTELLERTFSTFALAGESFVYQCRKVIVCDGCRILTDNNSDNNNNNSNQKTNTAPVSKKHSSTKQALRNGIATQDQATNYTEFKKRLQTLCRDAPPDSPFVHTTVQELTSRHGYGFALRHALRHCVTTPYVCVIQHDRTFMRPTPIEDTLRAMWHNRSVIKYVGMTMRSNLRYADIFMSKYGKGAYQQLQSLVLRPPELLLDGTAYGPGSRSDSMSQVRSAKVRETVAALRKAYMGSSQYTDQMVWLQDHPVPDGKHQLSLTPTLFWYDNTHLCETAHYRDFVFDVKLKMVARGGFVEDKLSPNITRNVERQGLETGHGRFGCYLLDDHCGLFFTGHLDGGNYLTDEQKEQWEVLCRQNRPRR